MIGPLQEAILRVLCGVEEATTNEICAQLEGKYEPLSYMATQVALNRLAKGGWVSQRKGLPTNQRGGKAQNYFALEEAGNAALLEMHRLRKQIDTLPTARPVFRARGAKPKTPEN